MYWEYFVCIRRVKKLFMIITPQGPTINRCVGFHLQSTIFSRETLIIEWGFRRYVARHFAARKQEFV